jgi:hypothetical protein
LIARPASPTSGTAVARRDHDCFRDPANTPRVLGNLFSTMERTILKEMAESQHFSRGRLGATSRLPELGFSRFDREHFLRQASLASLVLAAMVSCGSSSHSSGLTKSESPLPVASVVKSGSKTLCIYKPPLNYSSKAVQPTVEAGITGIDAYWLPSLAAKNCTVIHTAIGKSAALTLLSAINDSPPIQKGTFNCPAPTQQGVLLWFRHPDGEVQPVSWIFDACAGIRTPNRQGRTPSSGAMASIDRLAPPGFLADRGNVLGSPTGG